MKFLVNNSLTSTCCWVPMICDGDTLGKCDNCNYRFYCYTGFVPRPKVNCKTCEKACTYIMEVLDCVIFGCLGHVKYDWERETQMRKNGQIG